MKQKIIFLMAIFFALHIYAQDKYVYYIRVKPNHDLNPVSKTTNSDGTISLTFSDSNLNTFFNSKTIYQFYRPFENSNSELLQRIYKVTLNDNSDILQLLNFNEIEKVTFRQEGALLYQPNDYETLGSRVRSYLNLVHAPEAWDLTHGDPNVLVGISDTYFPYHEDMIGVITQEFDTSFSIHNHGIAVAGIVAANTDNGIGIASIGFDTRLVVSDRLTPEDMWNLAQIPGVKVLNGSWYTSCYGGINHDGYVDADAEIFREIWEDFGVVTVFAAGNGSCGDPNNYVYPASYNHTISVSSVGHIHNVGYDDSVWGRTNWKDVHQPIIGTEEDIHQHNNKVDLVAPGYNIVSLDSDNGYEHYWGTSSAAPQVAATCALMFAVNPDLTPDQVRDILLNNTDDIYHIYQNQAYQGLLGTGRLNVYRAVKVAKCMYDNASDDKVNLDLYIRNSDVDLAVEPDVSSNYMWQSKDIWVRNKQNGKYVQEHENPEYNPVDPSYVYVRVRNTSCVTSSTDEKLHVYWAKGDTSLSWPESWDGSLSANGVPLGGEIGVANIPVLKPGQETIIELEWNVPNPADYLELDANAMQFSLLARIDSQYDLMAVPETSNVYSNVQNNNNIAWKNITIVDLENNALNLNYTIKNKVFISNRSNEAKVYNLEFLVENGEAGKALYDEAEIGIKMDDDLLNTWTTAGEQSVNFKATANLSSKIVETNNALLKEINLAANQTVSLDISFNFLTKEITDKEKYVYHVIQRNAINNEIIGGKTFEIVKKPKPVFTANAGNNIEIDKNEVVLLQANEILNAKEYNWYDEDGNLVFTGKDLSVSPDVTKKYKLEIIDMEGYKDYDEIEITVNPYSLDVISPNPASTQVNVSYSVEGANSAYIMLVSTTSGASNNYIVNLNDQNTSIDVSTYPNGVYSIVLVCDGVAVDSKNLSIIH